MKESINPFRVAIKATVLFVAFNILFALAKPPVGKLTLFNHLLPGRLRFPYEQEPKFYFSGFNAPVYEDFDAMFGAHVISQKKANDEFRVILLGDSSTWGVSVQANDTLSEQINELDLTTCDDRNVRVYNLGYPMPFLMRDLLILDKAMEYEPDLVLWLVTLSTLEPKRAETYFILPHAERYLRLVETYDLSSVDLAVPIEHPSIYENSIIGQRRRLKNILFTQALGIYWAATGIDNHEGLNGDAKTPNPDVKDDLSYDGLMPGGDPVDFDTLRVDVLSAGYTMTGHVPIVLINQPIFIASGMNSNIRYNDIYPRWVYDDYRQFIFNWTQDRNRVLLDFWDALPMNAFSDRNFHRNSSGEEQFAALLAPELQTLLCAPH